MKDLSKGSLMIVTVEKKKHKETWYDDELVLLMHEQFSP